jgi:hypothetical protein
MVFSVWSANEATIIIAKRIQLQEGSKGKVTLELFVDLSGTVHMEPIPEGATVNKRRYKQVLRRQRNSIPRKRPVSHMPPPCSA